MADHNIGNRYGQDISLFFERFHHSPTHSPFESCTYASWVRIAAALWEQLGSQRTAADVSVRALLPRLPL